MEWLCQEAFLFVDPRNHQRMQLQKALPRIDRITNLKNAKRNKETNLRKMERNSGRTGEVGFWLGRLKIGSDDT